MGVGGTKTVRETMRGAMGFVTSVLVVVEACGLCIEEEKEGIELIYGGTD